MKIPKLFRRKIKIKGGSKRVVIASLMVVFAYFTVRNYWRESGEVLPPLPLDEEMGIDSLKPLSKAEDSSYSAPDLPAFKKKIEWKEHESKNVLLDSQRVVFRAVKGLQGTFKLRIWGRDPNFQDEVMRFRESIEASVANIFYFSGQNERSLAVLGREITEKINGILPESSIDSVQIENFNLSPLEK